MKRRNFFGALASIVAAPAAVAAIKPEVIVEKTAHPNWELTPMRIHDPSDLMMTASDWAEPRSAFWRDS